MTLLVAVGVAAALLALLGARQYLASALHTWGLSPGPAPASRELRRRQREYLAMVALLRQAEQTHRADVEAVSAVFGDGIPEYLELILRRQDLAIRKLEKRIHLAERDLGSALTTTAASRMLIAEPAVPKVAA